MSVAILVSGVLRSFTQSLEKFLNQLPENFGIFLSCPKLQTDQFMNPTKDFQRLLENPRIQIILFEDFDAGDANTYDQREKNTIIQWKRIRSLFAHVDPLKFQTVVRCRPDIHFQCDLASFLAYFRDPLAPNTILIPTGFDIFHTSFQRPSVPTINDQIAIGSYETMQTYCCEMVNTLTTGIHQRPLISEEILSKHLTNSSIRVERIDLPYTLRLSQCFTISICGDSASGKSSLAKLLHETLPFDKTLLFETDRYHKWERGSPNYQQFTHLHPEANHLEKLSTDAYKLRVGEEVYLVDYDHNTGKFTEPACVTPQNFTIFCGLHTLYLDSLRAVMDLKIYMDTEASLKTHWKLTRDAAHRAASPTKILETIQRRAPDFRIFVEPQRAAANILFQYYPREPGNFSDICLQIQIRKADFLLMCDILRTQLSIAGTLYETPDFLILNCSPTIDADTLTAEATSLGYGLQRLKAGYDGIIQYLFILLIWKPTT